jgi:MFS family permease
LLPIGLLAIFSLYGLLKKHFSPAAALVGLSFFIGSYPVFIYSFLARGYLLLFLFFTVALYAIIELCFSNGYKRRYGYLFVIASIAGLYSIPSFLYALAGLFLFAFIILLNQKRIAVIFQLVKYGFVIAAVTAVLYLPVLISVKWSLLKPYMTPVYDRSNTLSAFTISFDQLSETFLSPAAFIAFIFGCSFFVGLTFLLRSKDVHNKAVAVFVLLQLLLCMAVFFLLKQQFPPKPWMHFTVVAAFLAAAIYNLAVKRIAPYILIPTIILLTVSGTIASYSSYKGNYVTGYNSVAKKCEQLLIEKKITEVYTGIPYYKTMIDYYAIKNKLQLSLSNSRTRSTRYTPFDPQKKYDLIIAPVHGSKLPASVHRYDTVLIEHNTIVLLLRQQ